MKREAHSREESEGECMQDPLEEIIDETVIENCELRGACKPGLRWLRSKPRTYANLRSSRFKWYRWLSTYCTLPRVLAKLAADQDVYVRWLVARNSNSPVAVLKKLAADKDASVRREAKYHLKVRR